MLRFASKLVTFCFKARCVLLQDILRFASRPLRFVSCDLVLRFGPAFCLKTSCVLPKDKFRFASKHVAFCFKTLAFCFKARCFLLQSSLRFASKHAAFCFKTSCVLLQDPCVLSQDSCVLSHGGTAFCLLVKTFTAFWYKEFLAKNFFRGSSAYYFIEYGI
nr:hypothetical protein [Tanacetum cinerariifolium]